MADIHEMASGNLSLLITEDVSWDSFPEIAQSFLSKFQGRVIGKFDTPIERLWIVLIRWRPFFLVFDDFPLGLTLESMNRFCDPIIIELHSELVDENT